VAGAEAMGLRMHVADPAGRLWTVNTPCVPEGIDDAKLRGYLLTDRGIEIAGGFGPLAGKVFRIGLMGHGSTAENVLLVLRELEQALALQGFRAAGDAQAAAERVLAAVAP
jgi:alanine-glyoxylate transaminase / serine-glyoxylate transaminase / serine-pyruvate transaminase